MYPNYIHRALLVTFLAVIVLPPAKVQAQQPDRQEPKSLSLAEALAIAKESNYAIQMADADVEMVKSRYRQTNAAFLPQISIEETAITTNDPLSVFGFRLKQESVTASDFNPSRLNNPDTYDNFSTRFEVRQPVFNADKLYQRSAVKNQLRASQEQFESAVQQARFRVKDTYYQLLLADRRLEVIAKSLQTAEEMERQAKNFLDQGMISKADYLSARVRLLDLQSQQTQSRDQRTTIQDNLKYLLGIEEEVSIIPVDNMSTPRTKVEGLDGFYSKNSGLEALRYQVEAAEQMVNSSKLSFIPSLNLFGNYEFNDEVIFGTAGDSYMLGATLKWNLFSGFSNAGKVMQSKAELRKAKLAHQSRSFDHRLSVDRAQRSLNQAREQLELAKATQEQAEEDFRIRNDRYKQGMERTTDLLAAETKLSQSRLQQLNALYLYHRSLAKLELLLEQEF
jgi:outer membrane protein TolC